MEIEEFVFDSIAKIVRVERPSAVERKTAFQRGVVPWLAEHHRDRMTELCAEALELNSVEAASVIEFARKKPVEERKLKSTKRVSFMSAKRIPPSNDNQHEDPYAFTQRDVDKARQAGFKAGAQEQHELFQQSLRAAAPVLRMSGTGADYHDLVQVLNKVQRDKLDAGDFSDDIKVAKLPGRRKAEQLSKTANELLEDPQQYFWNVTRDEFGTKIRIQHKTFTRNQTITITHVKASSLQLAEELVRACLLAPPFAALSVVPDNRPGKKGEFLAKVAYRGPGDAQLARGKIRSVTNWRVFPGRLTPVVTSAIRNIRLEVRDEVAARLAAVHVPKNKQITLAVVMWIDAVEVVSALRIRLLDCWNKILYKDQHHRSDIIYFADWLGGEGVVAQHVDAITYQIDELVSQKMVFERGIEVQFEILAICADHRALWEIFFIPSGTSQHRDAWVNSLASMWESVLHQGRPNFFAGRHNAVCQVNRQRVTDLRSEQLKFGYEQSDGSLTEYRRFLCVVSGPCMDDPLLTRAKSVDWDRVLVVPPIMHDLHWVNSTVLDLMLQVVIRTDWKEHGKFSADLAAQRAVSSKGNLPASYGTVRKLIAEAATRFELRIKQDKDVLEEFRVFAPLLRLCSLVSKVLNSETSKREPLRCYRAFLRMATFMVAVLLPLLARVAGTHASNVYMVEYATYIVELYDLFGMPLTMLSEEAFEHSFNGFREHTAAVRRPSDIMGEAFARMYKKLLRKMSKKTYVKSGFSEWENEPLPDLIYGRCMRRFGLFVVALAEENVVELDVDSGETEENKAKKSRKIMGEKKSQIPPPTPFERQEMRAHFMYMQLVHRVCTLDRKTASKFVITPAGHLRARCGSNNDPLLVCQCGGCSDDSKRAVKLPRYMREWPDDWFARHEHVAERVSIGVAMAWLYDRPEPTGPRHRHLVTVTTGAVPVARMSLVRLYLTLRKWRLFSRELGPNYEIMNQRIARRQKRIILLKMDSMAKRDNRKIVKFMDRLRSVLPRLPADEQLLDRARLNDEKEAYAKVQALKLKHAKRAMKRPCLVCGLQYRPDAGALKPEVHEGCKGPPENKHKGRKVISAKTRL